MNAVANFCYYSPDGAIAGPRASSYLVDDVERVSLLLLSKYDNLSHRGTYSTGDMTRENVQGKLLGEIF